jgi:ADP-heptose:LPS heptosyltransferase
MLGPNMHDSKESWSVLQRGVYRLSALAPRRVHRWLKELYTRREIRKSAFSVIGDLEQIKRKCHPTQKVIGILLTEHFGDIIACEPVVPWLRSRHPDDIIVWLTRPEYVALLQDHPLLDSVHEVGSISTCRSVIQSKVLDRVIDLHLHRKPCTVFGREHIKRWGNPEVDIENYYHLGALLEVMSFGAGLPRLNGQPHLTLPREAARKVDGLGLPSSFVVVHTRSNERTRNWDDSRWNDLARILTEKCGLTLVEIGLEPLLSPNVNGITNLCGHLSLVETGEVIRRASFFVGVDSGPAHFANAFQIPSVILLGHYRTFDRYMPYTGFLREHAETMIIHWNGPASEIPVDSVLNRYHVMCNNPAPSCDFL